MATILSRETQKRRTVRALREVVRQIETGEYDYLFQIEGRTQKVGQEDGWALERPTDVKILTLEWWPNGD